MNWILGCCNIQLGDHNQAWNSTFFMAIVCIMKMDDSLPFSFCLEILIRNVWCHPTYDCCNRQLGQAVRKSSLGIAALFSGQQCICKYFDELLQYAWHKNVSVMIQHQNPPVVQLSKWCFLWQEPWPWAGKRMNFHIHCITVFLAAKHLSENIFMSYCNIHGIRMQANHFSKNNICKWYLG